MLKGKAKLRKQEKELFGFLLLFGLSVSCVFLNRYKTLLKEGGFLFKEVTRRKL